MNTATDTTIEPCVSTPFAAVHAPIRLVLRDNLTIYNAQSIKDQLLQALHATSHGVELDLTHVPEIDTAGVQLLLMFQRESQRLGRYGGIVSASPAVREALTFCRICTASNAPHTLNTPHVQ